MRRNRAGELSVNVFVQAAAAFGYRLVRPYKDTMVPLAEHLMTLFNDYGINCVIDVGANTGQFGSMLRANGYRGAIVSFEPHPQACAALAQTAAGDPLWRFRQLALGDESGTLALHCAASSAFSSLRPPNDYGRERFSSVIAPLQSVDVEVATLDAVWESIATDDPPIRAMLKLDTQGYDLNVLAGAVPRLPNVPVIQSELAFKPVYRNTPDAVTALQGFLDLGYHASAIYPLTRDKQTSALIECDCVFVKGE